MTDSYPSIKKNYMFKLIYEVLAIIIPLITASYISRVLEADGVGTYSYTSSIMAYFTIIAALGTNTYGAREIARNRNDKCESSKLFWEIELMTVISTVLCLCGWLLLILNSDVYKAYFIALIPQLFATMFDISWFYTGLEKIKYTVLLNSVCKILGTVALFVFVKQKSDLVLYIFIQSLVSMFGNISMWIYLPKFLVKFCFKELQIMNHFRQTLLYFIPSVAVSIYTVLDKTLIGFLTSDAYQNGYYEQATKIINICKTFTFTSVNSVMSARISYLFGNGKTSEAQARISQSIDFIFLLGVACTFGIIGVSDVLVPIYFGNGYQQSIPILCLMSPLLLIIGVSNCLNYQFYTPTGKIKLTALFVSIGAGINLMLNIILIPCLQAIGATIATIIAEMIITVLFIYKCDKVVYPTMLIKYCYKKMIAGIAMLFVVRIIHYFMLVSVWSLIVQIIVGAIVYVTVLIVLRDRITMEFLSLVRKIATHIKERTMYV